VVPLRAKRRSASGRLSHHAPQPFHVEGRLATAFCKLSPRLRANACAWGFPGMPKGCLHAFHRAFRGRDRSAATYPVDGDHHWLESQTAPAEPHAFTAKLHLDAGGQSEELPFPDVKTDLGKHDPNL
jgi:hypothetical protein